MFRISTQRCQLRGSEKNTNLKNFDTNPSLCPPRKGRNEGNGPARSTTRKMGQKKVRGVTSCPESPPGVLQALWKTKVFKAGSLQCEFSPRNSQFLIEFCRGILGGFLVSQRIWPKRIHSKIPRRVLVGKIPLRFLQKPFLEKVKFPQY